MLTQTARVRAGQPPGAPRLPATSLGIRSHVGTREWRGLRSLALVLAFVLAGTAVAARIHFASTPDPNAGKPAWASTWDPRVAGIASFVEHSRGLTFRHPVAVEFLSNHAFVAWVTSQRDETGGAEADPAVPPVALGAGNASPTQTDLAATSLVVGVYFPADRIVRVRGQALTADVRVTLAHELTHALQDQVFDLDALQQRADDDGRAAGLSAVLEGDAVTVERAYYDSLSPGEQAAVSSSETGDGGLSAQFSDARLASAYLPYVFGPQLIATLAATGGDKARNRALDHPPSSDLGVLDPALFIGSDQAPAKVSTPVPPLEWAPSGAEAHGTVGALSWYLALSARIDPRLVARTIEEWDGDSYASYRRGTEQCIDAIVHVRPLNTVDHLADVFSRWAWGNGPTINVVGDDIHITTCQPLAAGSTGAALGASLRVIYARNQLVLDGIEAGWTASLAHCMADRALMELPVETLTASPLVLPTDWADRLELYRAICAG
jgi:hypothetical protein